MKYDDEKEILSKRYPATLERYARETLERKENMVPTWKNFGVSHRLKRFPGSSEPVELQLRTTLTERPKWGRVHRYGFPKRLRKT
jgi:hypothetical protein